MLIVGLVAMSKRRQDKRIGANSVYILVAFLLLLLLEKSAARSVDIRQGMLKQSGPEVWSSGRVGSSGACSNIRTTELEVSTSGTSGESDEVGETPHAVELL